MKKYKQPKKDLSEYQIDPNKAFASDVLRANLMLSSLYLTAFEVLKLAIVEGVKEFFILNTEIDVDAEKGLLQSLPWRELYFCRSRL